MTSTLKAPLEHIVQGQILRYLTEKKIFHYRNNSGAAAAQYTNKAGETSTRYMQFGMAGAPDIIAVPCGLFVGIEVKRQGRKQSEAQQVFQMRVERAGGIYILAYCVEDVEKIINKIYDERYRTKGKV